MVRPMMSFSMVVTSVLALVTVSGWPDSVRALNVVVPVRASVEEMGRWRVS